MKNTGKHDSENNKTTQKGNQPTVQDKPDDTRVPTVTPDNDSGDPGPSAEKKAGEK